MGWCSPAHCEGRREMLEGIVNRWAGKRPTNGVQMITDHSKILSISWKNRIVNTQLWPLVSGVMSVILVWDN